MPGTHTGNKQTQARIFHLLLAEQSLTRQEIAETLHLSMPTALQNITELLQRGLLEECGVIQSTGGRKAKKICVRAQAGKTIGIASHRAGRDEFERHRAVSKAVVDGVS